MLTAEALRLIMPRAPAVHLEEYARRLSEAMIEARITTVTRAAAFVGQLAHESGDLRYMEELADGSAYEGRKDLGNTLPGDGRKYKGRGPIQLTGRFNYRAAGAALSIDLEANPERAAHADVGFRVAAWYWASRNLNAKADALDVYGITRAINGGLLHHQQRVAYYHRALEVLGRAATLGA